MHTKTSFYVLDLEGTLLGNEISHHSFNQKPDTK